MGKNKWDGKLFKGVLNYLWKSAKIFLFGPLIILYNWFVFYREEIVKPELEEYLKLKNILGQFPLYSWVILFLGAWLIVSTIVSVWEIQRLSLNNSNLRNDAEENGKLIPNLENKNIRLGNKIQILENEKKNLGTTIESLEHQLIVHEKHNDPIWDDVKFSVWKDNQDSNPEGIKIRNNKNNYIDDFYAEAISIYSNKNSQITKVELEDFPSRLYWDSNGSLYKTKAEIERGKDLRVSLVGSGQMSVGFVSVGAEIYSPPPRKEFDIRGVNSLYTLIPNDVIIVEIEMSGKFNGNSLPIRKLFCQVSYMENDSVTFIISNYLADFE